MLAVGSRKIQTHVRLGCSYEGCPGTPHQYCRNVVSFHLDPSRQPSRAVESIWSDRMLLKNRVLKTPTIGQPVRNNHSCECIVLHMVSFLNTTDCLMILKQRHVKRFIKKRRLHFEGKLAFLGEKNKKSAFVWRERL